MSNFRPIDRVTNAAGNVLAEGLRRLAAGELRTGQPIESCLQQESGG